MDEFESSAMRETMSEVYDRMTAGAAEEEAEREAERDYLSSLSEEELAKENRRQLEAIWDKHHRPEGEGAGVSASTSVSDTASLGLEAAPSHWSTEDRIRFSQLPRGSQEIVLNHVGGVEQRLLNQYQSSADGLAQNRWADYLHQRGARADVAFDELMTLEYTLRAGSPDQKRDALWHLAKHYGVDMLGPSVAQQNPAAAMLQDQMRQLSRQVAGEAEVLRRGVGRLQERMVTLFRDKTVNGKKAHPHFDAVQDDMGRLLQSGRAGNLKEAYTIAVSMRPNLRKRR